MVVQGLAKSVAKNPSWPHLSTDPCYTSVLTLSPSSHFPGSVTRAGKGPRVLHGSAWCQGTKDGGHCASAPHSGYHQVTMKDLIINRAACITQSSTVRPETTLGKFTPWLPASPCNFSLRPLHLFHHKAFPRTELIPAPGPKLPEL